MNNELLKGVTGTNVLGRTQSQRSGKLSGYLELTIKNFSNLNAQGLISTNASFDNALLELNEQQLLVYKMSLTIDIKYSTGASDYSASFSMRDWDKTVFDETTDQVTSSSCTQPETGNIYQRYSYIGQNDLTRSFMKANYELNAIAGSTKCYARNIFKLLVNIPESNLKAFRLDEKRNNGQNTIRFL